MKRIAAVVRPEKLEPLKEALFQAKISGMTIYQVHGCGNQHGWKEYFRGSEVFLNMIPKVKFEIVVESDRVDEIVNLITDIARTGQVGDGKIFVSEIERVIRVRTGEEDQAAVQGTSSYLPLNNLYCLLCLQIERSPQKGSSLFMQRIGSF